jgi:DNA polymerase III subunit gamma/tau
LRTVASAEGLTVDDEALRVIARHATGSLRDALGLLDQLAVFGERDRDEHRIDADAVRALLGVSRNDRVETLATALADRDVSLALGTVNAAVEAGEDARQLNRQLVAYLRVLLHQRAGGSPDADERAIELAPRFDLAEIAELARIFSEVDYKIRHSSYGHLPLEVALVEGILRRGAVEVAAGERPTSRPESIASSRARGDQPDEALAKPRTNALRDRVRGASATAVAEAATAVAVPEGAIQSDPSTSSTSDGAAPSPNGGALGVEQLVDLWPRIRLDVKAVNRRIEALLSSIDPVAVHGDEIVLAAAYAFHRDRMNADEVRGVVEEVIGRAIKRPVRTVCILRGEGAAAGLWPALPLSVGQETATRQEPVLPTTATEATAIPSASEGESTVDPSSDQRRLNAAKNIFDAEEIG